MADDKLRATPAARKLADDLGINLYDVSGSGANGRVHKEDVETYKDTKFPRLIQKILHNLCYVLFFVICFTNSIFDAFNCWYHRIL